MSILRRLAWVLSPATEGPAANPPGPGCREAGTEGLHGVGCVVRRDAAATTVVPPHRRRGRTSRHRPDGDREHLAALWIDLGGSD